MIYQRKIFNQTLFAFLVVNCILILLLVIKPYIGRTLFLTLGSAVFMVSSIVFVKIFKIDATEFGLKTDSLVKDIKIVLLVLFIVFPLFIALNHIYQVIFFKHRFVFGLREGIVFNIFHHLIMVAIPEEIFFRGFIQSQMERAYQKGKIVGLITHSNFMTSLLFAIGHFFINPQINRLAVFFPSLLFGYLREIRGNIYPSIVIHWLSNIIMYILLGMYL
jgi:membrane protease YdiL (CAAX protease family)